MTELLKLTINLEKSLEFGKNLASPNHPLHSFEVRRSLDRWVPTSDYVYACLRKFYPNGYYLFQNENQRIKLSGHGDRPIYFIYNAEITGD